MRFPKDALKVQTQQVLITLPQNDQNPAHVQEHTLKLREINDQNPTRVPTSCPNMTWTQHGFLQDVLTRPESNTFSYKLLQYDQSPTRFPSRPELSPFRYKMPQQDQNPIRVPTRCPNMTRTQHVFLQDAPTWPEPNTCSYKLPQHDQNPTRVPTSCPNMTWTQHGFLQDVLTRPESNTFSYKLFNKTRTQHSFLQDVLTRPEPNKVSYKMPQHELNSARFPQSCSNKTRTQHSLLKDAPNRTRTQHVFLQDDQNPAQFPITWSELGTVSYNMSRSQQGSLQDVDVHWPEGLPTRCRCTLTRRVPYKM